MFKHTVISCFDGNQERIWTFEVFIIRHHLIKENAITHSPVNYKACVYSARTVIIILQV